MDFVKKDFPQLTRTIASRMNVLKKTDHNVPFDADEIKPFTVKWGKVDLPKKDKHYLDLPSLFFRDKLVATLGFRNKSGYLMINDEVKEESHNAIFSRMLRLMKASEQVNAILREETNLLLAEARKHLPYERVNHWGYCSIEAPYPHLDNTAITDILTRMVPSEMFKVMYEKDMILLVGERKQHNVRLELLRVQKAEYSQALYVSSTPLSLRIKEKELEDAFESAVREHIKSIDETTIIEEFTAIVGRHPISRKNKAIPSLSFFLTKTKVGNLTFRTPEVNANGNKFKVVVSRHGVDIAIMDVEKGSITYRPKSFSNLKSEKTAEALIDAFLFSKGVNLSQLPEIVKSSDKVIKPKPKKEPTHKKDWAEDLNESVQGIDLGYDF